jgi:surface antigen
MLKNGFLLCAVLIVASCATQAPAPVVSTAPQGVTIEPPKNTPTTSAGPAYYKSAQHQQCVPYAREVSGIPIRGNAHTWWYQAEGKGYSRGQVPLTGAVFVLAKTNRLKHGHLSVVKNVVNSRKIEVEHTNWGRTMDQRCIVYKRMPVKDVSENNDWSKVRFWNYPSKSYGSVYKVYGFIYPK